MIGCVRARGLRFDAGLTGFTQKIGVVLLRHIRLGDISAPVIARGVAESGNVIQLGVIIVMIGNGVFGVAESPVSQWTVADRGRGFNPAQLIEVNKTFFINLFDVSRRDIVKPVIRSKPTVPANILDSSRHLVQGVNGLHILNVGGTVHI